MAKTDIPNLNPTQQQQQFGITHGQKCLCRGCGIQEEDTSKDFLHGLLPYILNACSNIS